jgi:sugar-specific transcriptional regulator TrmB
MEQNKIKKIFSHLRVFGLGETEIELYLQSLKFGPASIQELARVLKQNRVTVYSAAERLREKGFLTETRQQKRRLIMAADPKKLQRLAEEKINDAKVAAQELLEVIQTLAEIKTTSRYFPNVRFYEGVTGFRQMLEETLGAKNEVLVLSYVPLFSEKVGVEYLQNNILKRAKKGIISRLLFPPCPFADNLQTHRGRYNSEVRLMPAGLKWEASLFLWNDTAALASYKESRLTTTFIDNKAIVQLFRIMFKMIWDKTDVWRK